MFLQFQKIPQATNGKETIQFQKKEIIVRIFSCMSSATKSVPGNLFLLNYEKDYNCQLPNH